MKRNIDIDLETTHWFMEVKVHCNLTRWDEFESWLRADPRHRAAFKEMEQRLPELLYKLISG